MIFRFHPSFLFLITMGFFSCSNNQVKQEGENTVQETINENLLEANRAAVKFEDNQIDKLITTNGWQMIKTSTGLRYEILEKGSGAEITAGNSVKVEFEVRLISNELIYSSRQQGIKEFRVGSGGVESGLEEGIRLLKIGDKARFIIPSYLAHGLSGDQDKIPPKATIIYTIKPISIK